MHNKLENMKLLLEKADESIGVAKPLFAKGKKSIEEAQVSIQAMRDFLRKE